MANRLTLPEPGELIAGKYRVDCTLGSGGMGAVYQVTHRVTGKRFAMKWLLPQVSAHAEAAQRFIREAQVAGRFEHPHVVEVYDVGSEADSFYMVMELLEGESLAERVDRAGPLSITEACTLLIPCMRGVAEAHNAGIVHRDLKPANIFVCKEARHQPECAKVLDFGISKMSAGPGEINDSMTKSGTLIGTPHYMPLEQMRGKAIDHRADVYAFGVVLYQVLSGNLPYPANSFSDLVLMLAHETPPLLDEVVERIPRGLSRVVAKAMARDANDRYQSMEELIVALEPYTTGGHVAGTMRTPSGRRSLDSSLSLPTPLSTESRVSQRPSDYSKPAPARGAWLAGAAAVVLVVSLVAAAVWMRRDPKELATPEAAKPDTSAASAQPDVQPTTAARPQTSTADAVVAGERSPTAPTPRAANDSQAQPSTQAAADPQPPPTAAAQPVATPGLNANAEPRPNAPPPTTRPLPKRAPSTPIAARANAAPPPVPPQIRIEPRLAPPEPDEVEMTKPEPQARPKPPSRVPAMSAGDF